MDEKIVDQLWHKMAAGTMDAEDFQDYLSVFVEICNTHEMCQEEMIAWEQCIQWNIEGYGEFFLTIQEGKIQVQQGIALDPDLSLELDEDIAADLFMGIEDVVEIYQQGLLSITGDLATAARFRLLTEIVREEIENLHPNPI